MRRTVRALAVVHLIFVSFTALVGLFADGGSWGERIVVSFIHPLAAILLVLALAVGAAARLRQVAVGVILLAVAADVVYAALIAAGQVKGDWLLSVFFAAVPTVGAVYLIGLRWRDLD